MSGPINIPSDTRAIAFVLDREHVGSVDNILRDSELRNRDLRRLLSLWRRRSDELAFVVAAGHIRHKGVVGGMARTWDDARLLCGIVHARLDENGASGAAFTSLWMSFLTAERERDYKQLMADGQQTVGNA